MKGSDYPYNPKMMEGMLSTLKEVALYVVIEHLSGSLDMVTLQVSIEL